MWTRSSGAAARDVVRCGVGARMPLAIEHPEHRASSPTSWIPCCLAKHLKPIQSVGYKHGLVCLAEHLLYLQVRLKNCRTALGTIVHNFMIYVRIGGQSNKARKQSSNESRAPNRLKRESKARDVAAPEADAASSPEAYRTRAPKKTRNEKRAPYGVALGSKTVSTAEGHGAVFAPIAFETGPADQIFDIGANCEVESLDSIESPV